MPETLIESVPDTAAMPARNTGGAPRGNRNRIKSGIQSFTIGRFPRGCSYVAKQSHWLRRQLREAVTTQDGSTSIWSESVIASACQHEARRMLLLRWLRIEGDKLPVLDRATLLDKIGNATDSRDRCLKLLGLDALSKPVDPWASIYTEPATGINAGRTNDTSDDTTLVPSEQAASVDPGTSGDATNETNSVDSEMFNRQGGGE